MIGELSCIESEGFNEFVEEISDHFYIKVIKKEVVEKSKSKERINLIRDIVSISNEIKVEGKMTTSTKTPITLFQ
jgi:hypothetical protein